MVYLSVVLALLFALMAFVTPKSTELRVLIENGRRIISLTQTEQQHRPDRRLGGSARGRPGAAGRVRARQEGFPRHARGVAVGLAARLGAHRDRAGERARPRGRPLLGDRPRLQGGRARRGARQRHGRPCRAVRRQQRADDVASQRVAGVGPAAARAIARPRRRGGAAGLRRGLRGQCRAGTPAQSPPVRGGLARDAHPGSARRHRRVLPAAEARAASLPGGPGHRRLDGERPAAELRYHDDGPACGPHRARRRPCRAAGGEGLPVGRRGARRQVRLLQPVRRRAAQGAAAGPAVRARPVGHHLQALSLGRADPCGGPRRDRPAWQARRPPARSRGHRLPCPSVELHDAARRRAGRYLAGAGQPALLRGGGAALRRAGQRPVHRRGARATRWCRSSWP